MFPTTSNGNPCLLRSAIELEAPKSKRVAAPASKEEHGHVDNKASTEKQPVGEIVRKAENKPNANACQQEMPYSPVIVSSDYSLVWPVAFMKS